MPAGILEGSLPQSTNDAIVRYPSGNIGRAFGGDDRDWNAER
jgi:hypothetical protein